MENPLKILAHVAGLLDELSAPYVVVGSVASSLHGRSRATADVDLVVEIGDEQAARLVKALQEDFYVDDEAARRAVQSRRMFNAVHFDSLFKVDIYVAREDDDFTRQQLARRRPEELLTDYAQAIYIASPEDTLLAKLLWHRRGGEVSARQLSDAAGILKVQGERLDFKYLHEWADRLGVRDLLEKIVGGEN